MAQYANLMMLGALGIMAIIVGVRVMPKSGVLTSESSGDQIDVSYLNTVFELYPSYHFGQVIEAA
jgi:hypothetical protein